MIPIDVQIGDLQALKELVSRTQEHFLANLPLSLGINFQQTKIIYEEDSNYVHNHQ